MDQEFNSGDETLLRHYLLGELREEEQSAIEERLFEDDTYGEHLSLVEDELIDEYIGGELRGGEREHFESHFLSSPRRRERVVLSQAWLARPHQVTLATADS